MFYKVFMINSNVFRSLMKSYKRGLQMAYVEAK